MSRQIRSKMYEHFSECFTEFRCKILKDNGRTCDSVIKKKSASVGGAASNLKRHVSRFHGEIYRLVQVTPP